MSKTWCLLLAVTGLLLGPVPWSWGTTPAQPVSQQWAQERASAPGAKLYLSTTTVRQIQQTLNAEGYDAGAVSGRWNNRTARALRHYQQTRGLEPTGTPTLAVINALKPATLVTNIITAAPGRPAMDLQWSQETAAGPGVPVYVGPASIRLIQQRLNRRGFDAGPVDGIWGRRSSRATANFQRTAGLEPTGRLDLALILALDLGDTLLSVTTPSEEPRKAAMRWSQEHRVSHGTHLWASPAMVRRVQQAFNRGGLDVSRVSGHWDEETMEAARRFQKSLGLEPTGKLTLELLAKLGIGATDSGRTGADDP